VARWEIREARNGIEALAVAIEWNPEIIFLDMEMPEMSGTDFLHHLPDRNVLVIFQTAHERFALKAFEHAAVDFLLKPFTAERFQESLDRAIKQLQGRSKLAGIESMLQERKRFLRTFVVRVGERNRVIAEDEVVSFTSEDHVTMLCTNTISYAYQHSLA
jgi:two-component system LytT family response regulator